MIDKITVKNFRCYGNTVIQGFKRINLIGGLNNSGKTVLLEAILLNSSPTTQNVAMLKQLRGEEMDTKELPEYAWDNFFINQDKSKSICISANHTDSKDVTLIIDCNEEVDDFKQLDNEDNDNFQVVLNDFISNDKVLKSVLHFKYKIDGKDVPVLAAMAHKKGYNFKELNVPPYKAANYIPASSKRKPSLLARDYGIAEKRGKEDAILNALKIVDKNIEAIKVSVVGGAHLEIKRTGGSYMPISLFGDAINKILNIVLTIINNNGSIILIDEIENGIHHSVQKDFWRFLFQLATNEAFDVQIFSTTHSLEMMQAFVDTSENFKDTSAYFELYRRKMTGEIDYNLHDCETLFFELSNNIAVRGE